MKQLRIVVSSTRPGRIGPQVAQWVAGQAPASEWEVELLDLSSLPFFDEEDMPRNGNYAKPHTRDWASKVFEADAIVVVTPLGRYEGWDAVRQEVYVNFLQKTFVQRDLQASNVRIHVNGDAAWATFDWNFTGKMTNGQPLSTKGRESHVYEKTPGGWRITHLHYSGLMP